MNGAIGKTRPACHEQILDFDARATRYAAYVKELEKRRFRTGLTLLDDLIRGVAPGEVLTVIAYSGNFKSAFLQNLLLNGAVNTELYHLLFSMEMPVEKVFEREMQILTKATGASIENNFRSMSDYSLDLFHKAKSTGSQYVLTCDTSKLSIGEMIKLIQFCEVKYKTAIGAVGIDYLGLMAGEGKSIFERMEELSYGIKNMAKQIPVPVIVLGQVNRGYSDSKGQGIEMDAAKGGGGIEAGADFMLGLYMEEGELILKLLKNRNGPKGKCFRVILDKPTFRFMGLVEYEPPKKGKKKEVEL